MTEEKFIRTSQFREAGLFNQMKSYCSLPLHGNFLTIQQCLKNLFYPRPLIYFLIYLSIYLFIHPHIHFHRITEL